MSIWVYMAILCTFLKGPVTIEQEEVNRLRSA